ncbi:HNH endonuclease [Alicyclobacillus cycloheptanicus]|uniref:HNH domain-containing protein n=3 Tax=Alicyclobacillus cycloheptanicus TaxID=1457 RepID=A0ABT9XLU5_9BACL|nr:hypothetical protein [Alicyclobacillus cycloheptanicus]WDM00460.1 HNH endonuclease [Alicyclobacillus cycloheptanicus]
MAFSAEVIQKVWEKGTIVRGYDATKYRKDQCGAWMRRTEYGDRNSVYGWEIDHITSVAHGGSDAVSNLRPLNWQNNVAKSDGRLKCKITSSGERNVYV